MTDLAGSDEPRQRDQLREEAAFWFARMRGDDAAKDRAAFEAWLARGALHRAAYNRIGEVFAAGKMLKTANRTSRIGKRRATIGMALGTTAVMSGAIVVASLVDRSPTGRAPSAALTHRAQRVGGAVGPERRIRMPAGGEAILDVDGMVATSVGGRPGLSRLERGRVRFALRAEMASQRVLAGGVEVLSRRATFDLWLKQDGSLDAEVIAGDIQLRPAALFVAATGAARPVRLAAGQHYRVGPTGQGAALARTSGIDWPHGVLEYRAASLGDVLDEANRYSPVKVAVADTALAASRVSGRFRSDDPAQLAAWLGLALSLDVDATRPGLIILRQRKKLLPTP